MDKFVARKVGFNSESGYMVSQIRDGEVIVEQWLAEDAWRIWLEAVGLDESEIEWGPCCY